MAGLPCRSVDALEGQPRQPGADRELCRPLLEPLETFQDRRIDQIADIETAFADRPAGLQVSQFAPHGVVDRIEMILDQAEIERATFGLGSVPCGRQQRLDPGAPCPALPLRFALEQRHLPIDTSAQIGERLAQDRFDLESVLLRCDHARGQLETQAGVDAGLALRLRHGDLQTDQLGSEALQMTFKLPDLLGDHLGGALPPVAVEITKCGSNLHFR